MRGLCLLVIGLFLFAVACQREAAVDTRAADERAIRTADAACLKAAQAKDTEGVLSCYADDASWLPPNAPILTGKQAIRTGWSQLLGSPGLPSTGRLLNWKSPAPETSHMPFTVTS